MKLFITALFLSFSIISTAATLDVSPTGFYMGNPCFSTIQSAINASTCGDVIAIHPGTYQENLIVNKSISLIGDDEASTIILPSISDTGDPANTGSGIEGSNVMLVRASNVQISYLTIDGSNPALTGPSEVVNATVVNARNGIILDFNAAVDFTDLVVDHVTVKNIFERGIETAASSILSSGNMVQHCNFSNIDGNSGSYGVFAYWSDIIVSDNSLIHAAIGSNFGNSITFSNNAFQDCYYGISCNNISGGVIANNIIDCRKEGSFGIYIFNVKSALTVKNNMVQNSSYGIAVLGSDNGQSVDLADNTINGSTGVVPPFATSIGLYTTTEILGYTPGNLLTVSMSGTNTIQNVETGVIIEASDAIRNNIGDAATSNVAGMFTNNTTLNGLKLNAVSGNYIKLQTTDNNCIVPNIDATTAKGVSFDSYGNSMADGFAIEDKIWHKMDDDNLSTGIDNGLVTFIDKELFVTGNASGNIYIQRAIDYAPADGWRMNIKSGYSYGGNMTIDKTISYRSDGVNTLDGIIMVGSGKTLSLETGLKLSSTLILTDGIINTGGNLLSVLQDCNVSGAKDNSHVNGTVEEIGKSAFTFPVGNGVHYSPCGIVSANPASAFSATYHGVSPRSTIMPGTIVDPGSPPMLTVSDNEYWDINRTVGSSNAYIKLSWKDDASSGPKTSDDDFVVASHDATGWSNLGGSSSDVSGYLYVNSNSKASNFGSFALGSTYSPVVLPLYFTSFKVGRSGEQTLLKWNVAFDRTPISFNILGSTDGIHFSVIGSILPPDGQNAKEYEYSDRRGSDGTVFYKIEAVEQNNKKVYSSIIHLINGSDAGLSIICNNRQMVNMPLEGNLTNKSFLNVIDMKGQVIDKINVNTNLVNIDIKNSGTYLFVLMDAQGHIAGKAKTTVIVE